MTQPTTELLQAIKDMLAFECEAETFGQFVLEHSNTLIAALELKERVECGDPAAMLHKHPEYPDEIEPYNFGAGHLTKGDKEHGWVEFPLYALKGQTDAG